MMLPNTANPLEQLTANDAILNLAQAWRLADMLDDS